MRQATLIPQLASYWQAYTADEYQRQMRPLAITVRVLSPIAGYHNPHLDSLLAAMVIQEATGNNTLGNEFTPYLQPVPLKLIWRHDDTGIPLYAANQFMPTTHNKKITIWWHKRFIRPEMARLRKGVRKSAISAKMGRFKEKRTPMPAQTASTWRAECIGDMAEIGRLLEKCFRIGKKRMALVYEWIISPIDEFTWNRPLPLEYVFPDGDVFPVDIQYCSWSPPYWEGIPEIRGLCCKKIGGLTCR